MQLISEYVREEETTRFYRGDNGVFHVWIHEYDSSERFDVDEETYYRWAMEAAHTSTQTVSCAPVDYV